MAASRKLAEMAAQLAGVGARVRAGFPFTRSFQLRRSFPQSDKTLFMPSTFEEEAKLVHPLAGDLSNFEGMLFFTITGTAGTAIADGSPIPDGFCFLCPILNVTHDDAAARHHLSLNCIQASSGNGVAWRDSRSDPHSAFITNVGVLDAVAGGTWTGHNIIVPPGFFLRGFAMGAGAGVTVVIRGIGKLVSVADVSPFMNTGI